MLILYIFHSFVTVFVGGRSLVKTAFFFFYLFFLFFVFKYRNKIKIRQISWRWPIFFIFISYFLHLFLHFYFSYKYKAPIFQDYVLGGNGEILTSSFWHSHVAKGAIGQILYFFNNHILHNIDAGGAVVGFIHPVFFILIALVLTIAFFQIIWFYASNFLEFIEGKNKRQKFFLIFGYAIISFSLLETSIDGGFFVRGCFVSLAAILLFIWHSRKDNSRIWPVLGFSLFGFLLTIFAWKSGVIKGPSAIYLALAGAMISLLAFVMYLSEKTLRRSMIFFFLAIFLVTWWIGSAFERGAMSYGKKIYSENSLVYFYDREAKRVNSFRVNSEKSIFRLSLEMDRNLSYRPFMSPGIDCNPNIPAYQLSFKAITFVSPFLEKFEVADKFISARNSKPYFDGKRWHSDFLFSVSNCAPEGFSVLHGFLENSGIDRYILYDFKQL